MSNPTIKKSRPPRGLAHQHLSFLGDIGEITAALAGSSDIEHFLEKLVQSVATHLGVDVSSIYLFDEEREELVLRATHGLHESAIGQVRLKPGEGLVGKALHQGRAVVEHNASANPDFKHFPGIGEDRFEAFVAVPVLRGAQKIGVITAQRDLAHHFSDSDVAMLRAVAAQLAGTIENARALMVVRETRPPRTQTKGPATFCVIHGRGTSPGWATGPISRMSDPLDCLKEQTPDHPLTEDDFDRAVSQTEDEILRLQATLAVSVPEAASLIMDVHLLILKDSAFTGAMAQAIQQGNPVLVSAQAVIRSYVEILRKSRHVYIREKEKDVLDVGVRLITNLLFSDKASATDTTSDIVVARDLFPSDVVRLAAAGTKAIVLMAGGATTHVSILARSLQIPLVISEDERLRDLGADTHLLVDGGTGNIFIQPSTEILRQYETSHRTLESLSAADTPDGPAITQDGQRVTLLANINLLAEIPFARKLKAEGIGLYRTEFPFLIRPTFPTEDEQYAIYARLIDAAPDGPVIFRTLDVGGEKALSYYEHGNDRNPDLGLRSIRFSLQHPETLFLQCRAILRATAPRGDVRIMFPMVSSLDELRRAKAILTEAKASLALAGIEHHRSPKVGMMVEVPSVVPLIDDFCRESDFFSVGTNDFVQYMLAADRGNNAVAEYYCPHHPAVLRGLATVIASANKNKVPISICGEMAHQIRYLPFLIGIGCRSLSVDPHWIPVLHRTITGLHASQAETHARQLLSASTIEDVARLLPTAGDTLASS